MERPLTLKTAALAAAPLALLLAAGAFALGVAQGRAGAAAALEAAAGQQAAELARANGRRLELAVRALRGDRAALDALRQGRPPAPARPGDVLALYDAEFAHWLCEAVEAALAPDSAPVSSMGAPGAAAGRLEALLLAGRDFLARGVALPPLPPAPARPAPLGAEDDVGKKLDEARTLLDFRNPPPGTFDAPLLPGAAPER